MSKDEQELIAELTHMKAVGEITAYELDWCLGAMRVRHGVSRHTRHALRDTIRVILDTAAKRQFQE